jgi:Kinesin motor domain
LLGSGSEAGIISLAADELFSAIQLNAGAYHFKVVMLELYNEDLRDLLAVPEASTPHRAPPKLQIQVRALLPHDLTHGRSLRESFGQEHDPAWGWYKRHTALVVSIGESPSLAEPPARSKASGPT